MIGIFKNFFYKPKASLELPVTFKSVIPMYPSFGI